MVLFWALVAVVVGSFTGNYLAIAQVMPPVELLARPSGLWYVDLGRLWQIGKCVGILLWLVLMLRDVVPALLKPGATRTCWRCSRPRWVPSACSMARASSTERTTSR